MTIRTYEPVAIARQFRYLREAGANKGQRIEGVQRWCGGAPGDSWCCHAATFVFDICYQGQSPIPRTGSCDTVLAVCQSNGWMISGDLEHPVQPGDLVFSMLGDHDAHHIAIVTLAKPLTAIAGNTSPDGASSNGDGWYEHTISPTHKLFARVP